MITVVQWYKKAVLLVSTSLAIEPLNGCRRWSKKDNKYINIPRHNIVKNYDFLGGIDLIDRMISDYRIRTKTKKWTVKTILHFRFNYIAGFYIGGIESQ